jgi:D-alanyl-D-alanine carboxypeptidase
MAENAWRYGFVLSYPKDAFDRVCYDYEPWHFRYFGVDLAAKIHDSGQTLREYLWAVATGAASPSASAAAPGSASPSGAASAEPSSSAAIATPAGSPTPASPAPAGSGFGPLLLPGLLVIALGALVLGLVASDRRRRGRRRPAAYRVRTRR